LLLNAFHHFWPELLKTDFLYEFITPIVKVSKGKDIKYFYRHIEYKNWKEKTNTSGWFIKYYKGLGTILPIEAKEFFKHINKHLVPITWKEPTSSDLIDMVFNKKRAKIGYLIIKAILQLINLVLGKLLINLLKVK
jgi:DNA topoisomerase-2